MLQPNAHRRRFSCMCTIRPAALPRSAWRSGHRFVHRQCGHPERRPLSSYTSETVRSDGKYGAGLGAAKEGMVMRMEAGQERQTGRKGQRDGSDESHRRRC